MALDGFHHINVRHGTESVLARLRHWNPERSSACVAGLLTTIVFLGGCFSSAQAPVVSRDSGELGRASVSSSAQTRAGHYTVRKGDTLYSIAWQYGVDYRRLARWNGISEPYVIYPGQDIHLRPQGGRKQQQSARGVRMNKQGRSYSRPQEKAATAENAIKWQWPTPGKLVKLNTPIAKKGVNIAGRQGQSIKAAADGRVVYSGSGLLGYGKLIIIKHSDVYLSAYAHNDQIYVNEGDRVAVGQKIATMGLGNNGEPVLHFEIRKDGKPVSPLYHLPQTRS